MAIPFLSDISGNNATLAGEVTAGLLTIDNTVINNNTISNAAASMVLDSAGDIVLDADGGDIILKDNGTQFGSLSNTSNNLIIKSGSTTMLTGDGANVTFEGTIDSGAITALAKGSQFSSTGLYVNSTFKDVDSNTGVILGHNDTANGIGVVAGINQLSFLTYGSAWVQAMRITTSQQVIVGANAPRQTGARFSIQGGMSEFETTLTNNRDWENSPISILERGDVNANQSDDKYSPNLNFHWGGRVSNSLWMNSSGHLHYGSYSALGIPATDGTIKAGYFYGDGSNLTGVTVSNADTVDNLHAASFLRSDANDTATGRLTFAASYSDANSVSGGQGVTPFKLSFQASNRPGSGNYFTGHEYTFSDTGARGQLGFGSDGQNTVPHIYARTEKWGTNTDWQSWYRIYHTGYHPEADEWTTARTVTFGGGDVTGSFTIDGSADVSNVVLTVADDSHNHDGRYYTENEIDLKFTSSDGSEDEWKFTLGDESALTGNKWYKVATINQGAGGLHIKGNFANHVESFGTQHIDLLLQGREGNNSAEIEINGTVNVIHNAGTGTDKVGIRVVESDVTTSQFYHYYDVYLRTTRYTQAKFHLTKFGTTGFHTSKPSVTSEPAPVSGGSVELDTSTLAPGNHVVIDSSVKSSIADDTGYVGLGIAPTSNQRLTLAEADSNGSHIKMNNSRSGGGSWVVGVGDTNSSGSIVGAGGLFFYNGTTRLKFSSAGHATFANNVYISGDLEVTGTTTTVNQTNLDISDNIIGLNRGATSNANDSGLIIERGSTGDNAAMIWDEANDRFVFGLTTSTPAATGSVSITATSDLAARDLDVNNVTCGRILATAASTGIHQLVNASTNSTVLQLISTGDNPDHALNFQTDHIYTSGLALHIGLDNNNIYLRGSQTTVGTTTPVSGYELTVSNGPGKSIAAAGEIYAPTVEIGSALLFSASTTSATTTTTVSTVATASYGAAFFDYVVHKGSNIRAGTIAACNDGTNVSFAETSTTDLGDTSDVTFTVDISGGAMRLRATTTSSTWTIKSFIRSL